MITDDQLLSSPAVRGALARMRGVGLDKIAGVPTLEAAVLDLTTKFAYALLKQARIEDGLKSANMLSSNDYLLGVGMGVLPTFVSGNAARNAAPEGSDAGFSELIGAGAGALAAPIGGGIGYGLGRIGGRTSGAVGGILGANLAALHFGSELGRRYHMQGDDADAQLGHYYDPKTDDYEKIPGASKTPPPLRSDAPRPPVSEEAKIANILTNAFKRSTPAAATPAAAAGELPEFIRNFKPAPLPAKAAPAAPPAAAPKVKAKPTQTFDPHELQANAFLAKLKPASGTPDGPFRLSNMKGRTVTAALQIPGSIMRGGLAGAGVGAVGGAVGAGEGNRMQGALGGAAVGAGVGAGAGQLARTNYRSAMKGIDASGRNSQKLQQQYQRVQDSLWDPNKAINVEKHRKALEGKHLKDIDAAHYQRIGTLVGGTAAAGLGATGIAAAASPSERR